MSSATPTPELTVTDDQGLPWYNGDDLRLTLYMDTLVRHLPTISDDFTTLAESGYILDTKGTVLVRSAEQATDLSTNGDPAGHSFEKPAPRWPRSATKLDNALKDRFRVAPEQLDKRSRSMHDYILNRMETGTADTYHENSHGDGCALLTALFEKRDQNGPRRRTP